MSAKLNSAQFLATHQYQLDGTHKNRNECALSAMDEFFFYLPRGTLISLTRPHDAVALHRTQKSSK